MKDVALEPHKFLILVVDDLPSNLQVIQGILEPAGYDLTFACGGQQALERMGVVRPDLIILDLMMPDMDGLTVCKKLYENPEFVNIPVIFLTASEDEESIEKAFALGAVDYITKPFRCSELLARIHTHLLLKYTIDELRKTKLELLQALHDAERLARIDPLTGALNRRSWNAVAGQELQRAQRYGTPFAVLMLDCDRFKHINDEYGHEAGDRLLCKLVQAIALETRTVDLLGRYGGEEFVVLLPEAGARQAQQMAERLRQRVAAMSMTTARGTIGVTISLGVAVDQAGDRDLDTLLRRADEALYQAKRDGRNCVRGVVPESQSGPSQT